MEQSNLDQCLHDVSLLVSNFLDDQGGKTDYPTVSLEVFRKCWDILADWSNRSHLK